MDSKCKKLENVYIDFDENGEIVIKHKTVKTENIENEPPQKKQNKDINEIINEILANEPDEGPYKCTICNKSFLKKSYWKRHVLSHNEMFSCTICHRKFMHNHHLNQHMIIHRGPKEHECDICGFKVRFKFNLKKHRNIHIPYKDKNGEIKYITLK